MPEALYKKLKLNKEEFKNLLIKMYFEDKLSQNKISEKLNCHLGCIEDYFKNFNIKGRNHSESSRIRREKHCFITNKENEILTGLLLSDLHIEDGKFQSRLSFGLLHKEFAQSIIDNLSFLEWSKLKPYKGTRTPNINYFSKSKHYIELTQLRSVWYKNRNKIVPKDIVLTPEVLYWWYLGDGYLETRKYGLFLCTDAFAKEDNYLLIDKLKNLGFNCFLTPTNRIRFSGQEQMKKFLNYIGKSKLKCYEYKWSTE